MAGTTRRAAAATAERVGAGAGRASQRSTLAPRVVVATRPTEYEQLLARHATAGQAQFFLESRGQSFDALRERHEMQERAVLAVERAVPSAWRCSRIRRGDLAQFLFEPGDLVVAVGQDGLVANLAKYLEGQPVIGINPLPELFDGVLVPHPPGAVEDLLADAAAGRALLEPRTMVEARLDDGQRLLALNEIFIGHGTHQSARYRIRFGGDAERHSSSGVIVATGTGATGWARSIHRSRRSEMEMPLPRDGWLAFFVREAFPSAASGTSVTEGRLAEEEVLEITSEMDTAGVVFGDGIESDRLELPWGQRVEVRAADTRLHLVRA